MDIQTYSNINLGIILFLGFFNLILQIVLLHQDEKIKKLEAIVQSKDKEQREKDI